MLHISNKAAALQPYQQKLWKDWLFKSSFSPKTATKTGHLSWDQFLTPGILT